MARIALVGPIRLRAHAAGTALFVASGGIFLRLSAGALLAISAFRMDTRDFGIFALAFGATSAMAGLVGASLLDILTYSRWDRRRVRALRRCAWGVSLVAVVGWAATFWLPEAGALALTAVILVLLTATAITLAACARAHNQLAVAAAMAYWLPLLSRVGALLWPFKSATGAMQALTLALSLLLLLSPSALRATHAADETRSQARSAGLAASLSVAGLWTILAQADVLSLYVFQGAEAVATYVPTMRTLEALTAVNLLIAFTASKQLLRSQTPMLTARRLAARTAMLYLGCALPVLAAGPWLIRAFDDQGKWSLPQATALSIGYAASGALGLLLQGRLAAKQHHAVCRIAGLGIVAALLLPAILSYLLGSFGAALGTALAYCSTAASAALWSARHHEQCETVVLRAPQARSNHSEEGHFE